MSVRFIGKKDKHGVNLKMGDIVAEGAVGEPIWGGRATIVRRPLGIVSGTLSEPNLTLLRVGRVIHTDSSDKEYDKLFLSTHDGVFYRWEDIEKVGSVEELPD